MSEIFGYIASVLIGVSLGLIGGGGSILTVPVLVYLMGVSPVLSTAYSLFVVGTTSLVGAASCMKKKLIDYKTAVVFAVPSFIAVFLSRKFLVPAIPDPIFTFNNFIVTKDIGIMVFFAIIMLLASASMIRKKKKLKTEAVAIQEEEEKEEAVIHNIPLIAAEGLIVGTLTGIVGAGGGFLIIPALVLLARLPMKIAVGTSLLIIAVKSLIGFIGDIGTQQIDWQFLLIFTSLSVGGIFFGTWLNQLIHSDKLKKGFGWFVLIMAIYIIIKELYLK